VAEQVENGATLICVTGVVGAGKTTLARKLGQALTAKVLEEEVSGNELLEDFYHDPEQYALPVQAKFLLSRFGQLRADRWYKEGIVVTDYLFSKDTVFAQLNLKNPELQSHQGLWRMLKDRVRQPDAIVYLQAGPKLLLERIHQRHRSFEQGITREYLERLAAGYEQILADYEQCPIVRMSSASEPARNQQSWKELLRQLVATMPQLSGRIDGNRSNDK
jgi:deoxyadenosine/deoxycytidine kinase